MSVIKFMHPTGFDGVFPSPVPAYKKIPDYFKAIKPQYSDDPRDGTVKRCIPFLDALSEGFIIPLWADVRVVAKGGELAVEFPSSFPLQSLESHGYEQIPNHPMASKLYGQMVLKFLNPWVIETEAGYSCLFTSPLNHMETRFKILDGIVDTDSYYNSVHFPFLWTGGDGEFFIKKGTPLVQVIPIKREKTSIEVCEVNEAKIMNTQAKIGTMMKDRYKTMFWSGRNNGNKEEVSV